MTNGTIAPHFKRNTAIRYTYAGGAVVNGKVVRRYTDREIAQHARSHGEKAAEYLPFWVVCELTDEYGTHRGACHVDQLELVA